MLNSVYEFVTSRVLYWFECLSLIRRIPLSIRILEALLAALNKYPNLADLVHDCLRFIQYVYDAVEYSAMQTYFSALAWIPSRSPLHAHHTSLHSHAPRVLCGSMTTWTGPDQIINIHSGDINSIAVSQDGCRIVSGSSDGTVRIWNMYTHVEECVLKGHSHYVKSVAISRDGSRVISGSNDWTVRVWDIATQEVVLTLHAVDNVLAVAMSPDGKWIISGHSGKLLRVWRSTDGFLLHTLRGHTDDIRSVSFMHDSCWLISTSNDTTARIWNVATWETECVLHGHADYVLSAACSSTSDNICTGSSDTTARLWNASGKELRILQGHSHPVNCVAFMPDREQVATGSSDRTLRIWDILSGETIHIFTRLAANVRSVALFQDGFKLASSSGSAISIWSLSGGTSVGPEDQKADESLPTVEAKSMAFSPSGRRIMLLPSLRFLDSVTLEEKAVLQSRNARYRWGALSRSGAKAAATEECVIEVWELSSDDIVGDHLTLRGHTNRVNCVHFSHDEHQLVSASNDDTGRVWDLTTGKEIYTLHHTNWVRSVAFSHHSDKIVSATVSTVHIWSTHLAQQLHQIHADASSISFSPDDRHIIASFNGAVKIYNVATLQLKHTQKSSRYWTTLDNGASYALSDDGWICHFPHFGSKPHKLVWIPSQYRPTLYILDSPLIPSAPLGSQTDSTVSATPVQLPTYLSPSETSSPALSTTNTPSPAPSTHRNSSPVPCTTGASSLTPSLPRTPSPAPSTPRTSSPVPSPTKISSLASSLPRTQSLAPWTSGTSSPAPSTSEASSSVSDLSPLSLCQRLEFFNRSFDYLHHPRTPSPIHSTVPSPSTSSLPWTSSVSSNPSQLEPLRSFVSAAPSFDPPSSESASGPLFTLCLDGVQVCLPRQDGLVTLVIPYNNDGLSHINSSPHSSLDFRLRPHDFLHDDDSMPPMTFPAVRHWLHAHEMYSSGSESS